MDMNGIAATTIASMVDDGIDREEILDSIMYLFRFSISREQAQNVLTNYMMQRLLQSFPTVLEDDELDVDEDGPGYCRAGDPDCNCSGEYN